ncbi:MAG: 3-phosphoshikimate 1-carboxyvinyltransferase [Halanaerobiaceae bacterium]
MEIKISKKKNLTGKVDIPGDKSISHRAIIFSSLAEGKSRIQGFLESEDCLHTLEAFRKMGINIEKINPGEYTVEGKGLKGLKEPSAVLDCGNSGTCMRIMTGLLSAQPFYSVLSGDESLRTRPMARIIEPLEKMGAQIWSRQKQQAPLSIKGQQLQAINYNLPVASAQVKSSLLLGGLFANGDMTLTEPGFSRDHTERMLADAGIPLQKDGLTVNLPEGDYALAPLDIEIPGDISSAAFFVAAALLTENSEIEVNNIGLNPTRSGFLDVVEKMGGQIEVNNRRTSGGEPVADLRAKSSSLQGINIKGEIIPRLIDEIPIIAVLASRASGRTVIRDAEELRVKETDRIEAIVNELSKLGVKIAEFEDGMIIEGPTEFKGGQKLRSYGDHRIAMSLVVAGLTSRQPLTIENCDCIRTSFPQFQDLLFSLI